MSNIYYPKTIIGYVCCYSSTTEWMTTWARRECGNLPYKSKKPKKLKVCVQPYYLFSNDYTYTVSKANWLSFCSPVFGGVLWSQSPGNNYCFITQ